MLGVLVHEGWELKVALPRVGRSCVRSGGYQHMRKAWAVAETGRCLLYMQMIIHKEARPAGAGEVEVMQ